MIDLVSQEEQHYYLGTNPLRSWKHASNRYAGSIGQHCIFQDIFVVLSGHSNGHSIHQADIIPRDLNSDHNIATLLLESPLCKANMVFLNIRASNIAATFVYK